MAEEAVTRTVPAEFIEALGKTYGQRLTEIAGQRIPVETFTGEQFVAPESALAAEARGLRGGLGAFQPYITGAEQAQTRAAGLTGPTAYQQFMSPYQQDVIDTTLAEFDVQAAKGIPALRAQAIQAGAFGGGREGVAQAEYAGTSARNRAALQAQLLQQGFGQAQQLAAQAFGQQQQLGQAQMQLAGQVPALVGQQIAGLSTLGAQQQAQQQAVLEAQRQAAQASALEESQRVQQFGSGVASLISGYPAQTQIAQTPSPSPLATALGVGSTLAGIYKAIK